MVVVLTPTGVYGQGADDTCHHQAGRQDCARTLRVSEHRQGEKQPLWQKQLSPLSSAPAYPHPSLLSCWLEFMHFPYSNCRRSGKLSRLLFPFSGPHWFHLRLNISVIMPVASSLKLLYTSESIPGDIQPSGAGASLRVPPCTWLGLVGDYSQTILRFLVHRHEPRSISYNDKEENKNSHAHLKKKIYR